MKTILAFLLLVSVAHAQRPCVARVEVEGSGVTWRGSGVLIGKDSERAYVLTNAHVLRGGIRRPVVYFPVERKSYTAIVVKTGDCRVDDLALLLIAPPTVRPVKMATGLDYNSPLTIAGYGGGRYLEQRGRFRRFLRDCFLMTPAARQGDSGGPVFDRDGELVGCLFGTSTLAPETLALDVGSIRTFLRSTAFEER